MTDRKFSLTNLIREPLTIFSIIALLIFVLDMLRPDQPDQVFEAGQSVSATSNLARIEIDEPLLIALKDEFSWLAGREPSAEETEQIIAEWLEEEIIFRHTLMTEQHLNDGKVREHMIEKVSLLWAGLPDDPTDEQVLQHYMDNISFYYSEPKASFVQLYFNQLPEDSENIAARLNDGEKIQGDAYWLGNSIDSYAESVLRTNFGGDFYEALKVAPLGSWIGPLTSPRGYHYVSVSEVTAAVPLRFEDIYSRVRTSWTGAEQRRRISEQVDVIRPQFDVVYEVDVNVKD
jgi:hypothetical protein